MRRNSIAQKTEFLSFWRRYEAYTKKVPPTALRTFSTKTGSPRRRDEVVVASSWNPPQTDRVSKNYISIKSLSSVLA